jgi:small subunit ribosomal protein S35
MPIDQDWSNIWPTKAIFRQSAIPLPVNQGFVKNLSENQGLPPGKYGNTELMKISNFLHLTPPHIKKHCEAIKSNFK